jgi:hypothetical protein
VATIPNIYLRDDLLAPGAGSYTLLSDCPACTEPIPDESPIFQPGLAGASADFGHLFFESVHNLTAETINANAGAGLDPFLPKLYEWDHGTVRLAGVLPDGSPAPSSAAGLGAGAIGNANLYAQPDVVSRDGSRVVFTSPVEGESYCEGACDLYLRDTHDTASTADDETIQLNTDNGTTYEPALFQGATSGVDASGKRIPIKVFFTSGPSLYVYDGGIADAAPDNITKISDGPSAIIGESEDGAYVYFISDQQLDPGSPIGCDGTTPCIFVWHQGTLRSVAKINGSEVEFDSRSARLILSPKAAALTPDGTHLLFRSEGSDGLTGYDQGDSCPGDRTGSNNPACAEIYVYDATANGGTGELLCASCNPSGAPATADADIDASFNKSVAAGGTHLPHAISDDGRYVFFSTAEGLVPRDTNGVSDAYEFDTTTREVHLISSGTASADSYFLDAGANGHDVFFVTRGRLLAWDHDESQDLYDARIGGGFPEPPPVPAPCAGDDCQGSQTSSPEALSPASANAIGFGNPHRRRHHHKKHRHRRQRPNHHRRRSR